MSTGPQHGVALAEQVRANGLADQCLNLLFARHQLVQIHVVAFRILAQRLSLNIHVNGAGQRVGDD
ncbi:hypothetical protein D3C87_1592160 [compost metagenome]